MTQQTITEKRADMFHLMLSALADSEQILYRVGNQDGQITDHDLTDARNAHDAVKLVMEIIKARQIYDTEQIGKARRFLTTDSPFDALLRAAVGVLPLVSHSEGVEREGGGASVRGPGGGGEQEDQAEAGEERTHGGTPGPILRTPEACR